MVDIVVDTKWHCLSKQPTEYPQFDDKCLVCYYDEDTEQEEYELAWNDRHTKEWKNERGRVDNVLAWKYIDWYKGYLITERDIVTSNAIMEQWLANNQERPKVLTIEMLADIILYKSKNIKAHIPAWVFEETFNVLREDCLNYRKVDFKIYTEEDLL